MTILSSLSGVNTENYKKLEYLLKKGDWQGADSETARLMLMIGTQQKRDIQYLNHEEIKNFSYQDLCAITVLWKYYSDHKFGFTSQAIIWDTIIRYQHKKQHFLAFFNLIAGYLKWVSPQDNELIINSPEEVGMPLGHFPRWSLAMIPTSLLTYEVVWKPGLEGIKILNHSMKVLARGNSIKIINAFLLSKDAEISILKDFFSLIGNQKLEEESDKIILEILSYQFDKELDKKYSDRENYSYLSENENLESTKSAIESVAEQLDAEGDFTPKSREETRERISRSIAQRRGQPKFRKDLLEAYGYRCAITGCDAEEALEAAHIIPYCETEDNAIYNGLLLRADIHTLFDLNLIAIAPGDNYPNDIDSLTVHIAPSLLQTSYGELHNNPIKLLPKNQSDLPNKDALISRCEQCSWFM